MNKIIPAMCLLPFAISKAYAGEFTAEPAATVYWQIPLASTQSGMDRHAFGFRMDQVVRDNTGNLVSSFSAPLKPAVVDFRFTDKGVKGVYMNGINMTSPAMKNAFLDMSTEGLIVGGTLLAATTLAIISARDNGGTSGVATGGEGGEGD
jgi:hypothetical protein